jgi:hypothetical protein
MKKNFNVEAEGGELILSNKTGDHVIIPKNRRNEVKSLLKEKCFSCIDKIVNTLPIMEDYADDGTVVSALYEQKTGKDWSTAKEEGLTDGSYEKNMALRRRLIRGELDNNNQSKNNFDYSDKQSFADAFATARSQMGANKIFKYKGKTYTTNVKGEKFQPEILSETPASNELINQENQREELQQPTQNQNQESVQSELQNTNETIPNTVNTNIESEDTPASNATTKVSSKNIQENYNQTPVQERINTPTTSTSNNNSTPPQTKPTKKKEEEEPIIYGVNHQGFTVKGKRGLNKDVKIFEYEESEKVKKLKKFQQEKGLPVTGVFDEKTSDVYYDQSPLSREKYEQGLERRNKFKEKVRTAAQEVKSYFGMKPEVKQALLNWGVDNKKINHCIGGICNFLDSKVEKGLFKGNKKMQGFFSGSYFDNAAFEREHRNEGWQKHTDYSMTTPDIGDIIRIGYKKEKGRNHAMIVVDRIEDKDNPENTKLIILDNTGTPKARKRTFTIGELIEKYETEKFDFNFYRRTKFDDVDIAEEARALKNKKTQLPDEFKGETFNHEDKKLNVSLSSNFFTKSKQYKFLDGDVRVNVKSGSNLEKYKKYIEGINSSDITELIDIPEEDVKKIAVISASLPYVETELGGGLMYKAEKASRGIAKTARLIKKGTPTSKTLSVGLSQINPDMLSKRIKDKYFKGMSSFKIETAINNDEELQGKISFEIMVDRYRQYRDSGGAAYGNDNSKFWYALINSWQSPNKIKRKDAAENLENYQWDYSNKALEIFDKINVDLK